VTAPGRILTHAAFHLPVLRTIDRAKPATADEASTWNSGNIPASVAAMAACSLASAEVVTRLAAAWVKAASKPDHPARGPANDWVPTVTSASSADSCRAWTLNI